VRIPPAARFNGRSRPILVKNFGATSGFRRYDRSKRRLCEEVHLNLAYRWFCRLGLEDKLPDHSSFSKNRRGRFRESNVFRHVFEGMVRRCMAEGLVRG
jgi:transposase